jgi:hypothetical protein
MSTKIKVVIIAIAVILAIGVNWIIQEDYKRRPTIETKSIVYIVPWPWQLVYQDGALWMRLEVQ